MQQESRVAWICVTCGTQQGECIKPPTHCAICSDDRQYIGWEGQQWIAPEELGRRHEIIFAVEDGVSTMHVSPRFGIGQRAFLIPYAGAHLMWECLSPVTDAAVATLGLMGGVAAIAISHPHFYASMVEWSEALGDAPVYLHADDREWVPRHHRNLRFWEGETLALNDTLVLIRLGAHFPGSAGLWWKDGPTPGGSLFPGDAIQVVMDRRHATFMYSYPNLIPHSPATIEALRARVAGISYQDVFGYSPGRQIIGNAKADIEASFDRYLRAIAA